jgi:hypothetical protein
MAQPTELDGIQNQPGDTTEKRMQNFLHALVLLGGNSAAACRHLKMSTRTPQVWRKTHAEFARAYDEAAEESVGMLVDEAHRRAFEGVLEPVFYQGVVSGHVRRYSDALLMFLLKGYKPKTFGTERVDATVTGSAELIAALRAGRQRTGLCD